MMQICADIIKEGGHSCLPRRKPLEEAGPLQNRDRDRDRDLDRDRKVNDLEKGTNMDEQDKQDLGKGEGTFLSPAKS